MYAGVPTVSPVRVIREAEIEDLHAEARRRGVGREKEDVRGLQVAVHRVRGVDVTDRDSDRLDDGARCGHPELAGLELRGQRAPLE
jgi:hypothetical protein